MQEKYTVSEIARLFGISNQTLRYYDKIGLFKPETTDPKTGYRFYTHRQFFNLSLILRLKKLHFSLESIRKYSEVRNIDLLEESLIEQKAAIHQQIAQLQLLEAKTDHLLQNMSIARHTPQMQTCQLVTAPDRFQYEVPINFEIKDIYAYIKLVYESYIKSPFATNADSHGEFVLKIHRENLCRQRFRIYNSIGFFLDEAPKQLGHGISRIDGGTFASVLHFGAYDKIDHSYEKLFAYISENGLSICGDSVEYSILNISLTENPADFITQIQIPVSPT